MIQKTEEGKLWEQIEKEKAKQRQLSGLNNQSVVVDNVPQREENGKSRDIIASKVGIGSGRTYAMTKEEVNIDTYSFLLIRQENLYLWRMM